MNLSEGELVYHCLTLDDCQPTNTGAVAAYSGKYTGRTPKDKYVVRDAETQDRVWWDGNNEMSPETYAGVRKRLQDYLSQRPLYVVDTFAGADPHYRIRV